MGVNGYKSGDEILASNPTIQEVVDCPEWDTKIIISAFSIADKQEWAKETAEDKDGDSAVASLVVYTARKEDGSRMFTKEQISALTQMRPAYVLERLAEVASRINKLRIQDQEESVKN